MTPRRLDDVADLFNSNGTTRGCWCMFFLLKRQDYMSGRAGGNETAFRERGPGRCPPRACRLPRAEAGGVGGSRAPLPLRDRARAQVQDPERP